MGLPFELDVNEAGHLRVGGVDAIELADAYGTPLYVVDEEDVRGRCRRYRRALERLGHGSTAVYAAKAFWTAGMALAVDSEGLGVDVSSEAEMRLAVSSGIDPSRLVFHGNNKSRAEMELSLSLGVGRIVADSLWEVGELTKVARAVGRRARVLLRLVPGVEAGAHGSIQTGHERAKFGIPIEDGQAEQAVRQCLDSPHIELLGYHAHIGSQILSLEPYRVAARLVGRFAVEMHRTLGARCQEIDMGGGLGVRYTQGDAPPSIEALVDALAEGIREVFGGAGLPMPALLVEPGRSIVAEAGVTLYRIGSVKRLATGRLTCAVDGGMSDNPRVALYGARYTAVLARNPYGAASERVEIVGRLCESGDVLVYEAPLPAFASGDVVALLSTGAYHHSMASNYNGLPRPPVVAVRDGHVQEWVRREHFGDQVATDVVLGRLAAGQGHGQPAGRADYNGRGQVREG